MVENDEGKCVKPTGCTCNWNGNVYRVSVHLFFGSFRNYTRNTGEQCADYELKWAFVLIFGICFF